MAAAHGPPTYDVGHLRISASFTMWASFFGLLAVVFGAALVVLVGRAKARATKGTRALGPLWCRSSSSSSSLKLVCHAVLVRSRTAAVASDDAEPH